MAKEKFSRSAPRRKKTTTKKEKVEKGMNSEMRWPNQGHAPTGGTGYGPRPASTTFMPGANFGREIPLTRSRLSQYKTIGDQGLEIFGGYVTEEFRSELQGLRGTHIYEEMRKNDAVVGAMLFVARQLIQNATLLMKPNPAAKSNSKAQEWADFVEECIYDMDRPWPGYKLHTELSSRYDDGKTGWKKIALRSQKSFNRWITDENGSVLGFEQTAPPTYQLAVIPISNAAHFRTQAERNNPEGKSILRNAWRPWVLKKHIEETEVIAVERDVTGIPLLIAPEGMDLWNPNDSAAAATLERAENIVRLARLDKYHGIVLPFGWEFSLQTTPGQRAHNTSDIICRWDQRIAITLLADMLLIGHERVGSFAMVQAKTKLFSSALESYAKRIAGEFNRRLIPRLMLLNNVPMEYWPTLEFGPVETPALSDLAEYIKALSDVGINIDDAIAEYMRQVASLPPAKDGDKLIAPKPGEPGGPPLPQVAVPGKPGEEKPKPGEKPKKDNETKEHESQGTEQAKKPSSGGKDE
jgi:hypothetical protein